MLNLLLALQAFHVLFLLFHDWIPLGSLNNIAAVRAENSTPTAPKPNPPTSAPAICKEKHMDIQRVGTKPSGVGPADWFTGTVRIDPLFQAPDPALVQGASVTFEPGARTAWHTHPLGQTLIVTAGSGYAQRWDGPIEPIHPGDVVWFAPNEKHWHGATPTTALTHIAIQERLNNKVVDWREHVTDEQYTNPPH